MSLATIRNPLDPTEALLFYCTNNKNLALEHRTLGSGTIQPYNDNGDTGRLVNPGDFAAIRHDNTIKVFGIISYKDSTGVVKSAVSEVSPVLNPINVLSDSIDPGKYPAVAATSNGKIKGYVFYLREGSGTADKPDLWEYSFQFAAQGHQKLGRCSPSAKSRLAACYSTRDGQNTAIVFFQDRSGEINWVNLIEQSPQRLPNTSVALDGTPLGLSVVDHGKAGLDQYLYFVDRHFLLQRTFRLAGDSDWHPSHAVSDAPQVDSSSGISVVPDKEGNRIFYIQDGATQFTEAAYERFDEIKSQEP